MYKPDKQIITRLLMLIDPMFFSHTDREKDKRRQHYYEENRDKVERFLYRELFGLTFDGQTEDDPLTSSQRHLLNAHTTALTGIGKNSFRLCELQGTDFDLTSFDSLYDYDLDAYEYQQEAIKADFPSCFVDRDYRLYLNHNWVRVLDSKGHFYYSTLSSLSYYLYDALEEVATEIIESLIPYDLVDGDDHGKNVDGGMLWDFKTDAKGLEAELEELQSRNRTYLSETYDQLNDEFQAEITNEIYFEKQGDEVDGPSWNVIVNNAETARKITFINFLDDCQDYLQSNEKLEHIKEREGTKLKKLLIDAYEDIVKNFDPTVVKLKKKMKIVMSPKALDGLNSLGDDSE
tara:strand:- start:3035 stop:4075 length:1041 start_codon:yes stop_codon:yes gene_type:complete